MNRCLDLFATVGGMRQADEEEIINRFRRAYVENPDIAMKLLFYTRDVREGLGERRFFKVVLKYLCNKYPESVIKNIEWIAEYGRFDDLLVLLDTPCEKETIEYIKAQLDKDINLMMREETGVSLLAKWLPSINTSDANKVRLARKLAKAWGMSEKEYRKTLSALRKEIDIIENHLREVDYSFDYETQTGKSMLKYRAAFYRNDKERYGAYLKRVMSKEAVMHTDTLMPYEIIRPLLNDDDCFFDKEASAEEAIALDTAWKSLKNFAGEQNALVVIDGSGSMYWGGNPTPASVAQSLGLYFAENNKGAFANHFITFSTNPRLVEVKGETLKDKVEYISSFNECANTDIQKVFDLLLRTACNNNMTQEDMPERIIIISDMEFDCCVEDKRTTNYEYAKKKFEEKGFVLPKVVFWNVASRKQQLPITMNEQGVTLVSGCNARLFEQIATDNADPMAYMIAILDSDRYEKIVA